MLCVSKIIDHKTLLGMSASRWLAEPLLAADVEHSSSILTQFQQTISLPCRDYHLDSNIAQFQS